MKRLDNGQNRATEDPRLNFQDVFSSLQNFNRSQLTRIIDKSKELLQTKCSEIVESLPEEIWQMIVQRAIHREKCKLLDSRSFLERRDRDHSFKYPRECGKLAEQFFALISSSEKILRSLCYVSRTLSSYIHNFIQTWFVGNHPRSNWLLSHFTSETHLDLYLNSIITGSTLLKMTNLKSLKADHNSSITNSSVCQLSNLTSLHYADKHPSNSLGNLTNLNELKLSFSLFMNDVEPPLFLSFFHQTSIEAVTALTNLTKLQIYPISLINDSLMRKLPRLKSLSLQSYPSDSLSNLSVSSLTQLTHLEFCTRSISDYYLHNLTNLIDLNIALHSGITNIGLQNLTQLTRLNIKNTSKIDHNGISHLTNLSDLNLTRVSVQNMSIQNLTSLKRLILQENHSITDSALWNLTNLTHLNLNFQTGITDNALKRLTQLTHLEIRANSNITDDGLSNLVALTYLNISSNFYVSDRSLSRLTNLTTLDMRNYKEEFNPQLMQTNRLTISVPTFTTLSTLYISNNSILSDRSISHLTNLTELICGKDQISPECLLRFPKLVSLNPFLKVDRNERDTL